MRSSQLSFKAVATALLLCLATVNAHMIMLTPMPYGKSTLNNSPLDGKGSDFPCKQRPGVYDLEGAVNNLVIGEPQTLSFQGSAVHGGGSCQVSLTTDQQPTGSSKWMVIHSIQGNCPSNVSANLEDNAAGTGAATFQYTIPQGITPGQYTIAWSWVNKIGNREFYMNCGPATITAPAKKRYAPAAPVSKRQSSFPDLFVANIAGFDNGCTTTEGYDVLYPNPGSSAVNGTIGTKLALPPCAAAAGGSPGIPSSGPAPAATSSADGGSPPGAPSASPSGFGTSSAFPTAISSAGSPGVFASGTASAAPVATSTALVSPIPAASQAPAAASSSASAGAPAPSGSTTAAGAQSGPCTDEGAWYCSTDGSSFQRCASGNWSVPMAMAAGTSCTPGLSDTLNMTAAKSRRFGRSVVRRAYRLENALRE